MTETKLGGLLDDAKKEWSSTKFYNAIRFSITRTLPKCYTVIAIQAFSELVISMQTLKVDIK